MRKERIPSRRHVHPRLPRVGDLTPDVLEGESYRILAVQRVDPVNEVRPDRGVRGIAHHILKRPVDRQDADLDAVGGVAQRTGEWGAERAVCGWC